MRFDIYSMSLQSSFFAGVVETACPDLGLEDFALYVVAGDDPAMKEEIEKLSNDLEVSKMRPLWHYNFSVRELPTDDEEVNAFFSKYIEEGKNLIMPIDAHDREEKVFLMGHIDKAQQLEMAFGMMSVDAQRVGDECGFAAYSALICIDPEAAKSIWMRLIDFNSRAIVAQGRQVSFRSKYSGTPSHYDFLGDTYASAYSEVVVNYRQRDENIQKFPDTILSFIDKGDKNSNATPSSDFVSLCNSLSPSEKHELILELAKSVGDSSELRRIIDKVTKKDAKANLKIQIVGRYNKSNTVKSEYITNKRPGDYQLHLVKTDDNGKATSRELIDIESGALVIYIMYLLYIREHGSITKPLDVTIPANIESFKEIFRILYPFGYKKSTKHKKGSKEEEQEEPARDEAEETAEKIFKTFNAQGDVKRSRLNDWFDSIANCLNQKCAIMKEDPTPYKPSINKAPTLTRTDIIIPDSLFKNISIV